MELIDRRPSKRNLIKPVLLLLVAIFISGCASTGGRFNNPADPIEGFNRGVHHFNRTLDDYALKPLAKLYNFILPRTIITHINNFFSNIGEIPTIANDLLQFNIPQALSDFWRLLVNSTVGIAGFFDVASDIGLHHHSTDLGLTFKKWGYENSAYLVLPFFGPSTVRDAIALPINYTLFSVYPRIHDTTLRYSLIGWNIVNRRAVLLEIEDVVRQAAIDRYIFERNAYLQRRKFLSRRTAGEDELDEEDLYFEHEAIDDPYVDLQV